MGVRLRRGRVGRTGFGRCPSPSRRSAGQAVGAAALALEWPIGATVPLAGRLQDFSAEWAETVAADLIFGLGGKPRTVEALCCSIPTQRSWDNF